MIPNKENINDGSYTYEKSDIIPDWVNRLDALKSQIKAQLHSPDNGKNNDIKFCHPINVPNTKK
jgi:hypothetical protein